LLTEKDAEAQALRAATVNAEERQAAALVSLRGCEDALAAANARNTAYETSERELQKAVNALTIEVETSGQAKAVGEAEIATLRDELSRRPPIDVIRAWPSLHSLQRARHFLRSITTLPTFLSFQASSTSRIFCSVICRPPRRWGSCSRGKTITRAGPSPSVSRRAWRREPNE
jgi:hypothetical protein